MCIRDRNLRDEVVQSLRANGLYAAPVLSGAMGICVPVIAATTPVSYTHLDVYKRQVYNLINTRLMAERPTIISTNLSISELENRYSERVVSRIIANYRILPFIGRDVRQLKRMREAGVNYQ